MKITLDQLKRIMPRAGKRAALFLEPLCLTMAAYEINTRKRAAAFLAQLAHESMSLVYTEEIASGENYEGRRDLGNLEDGDGVRFKGHGLIQLTGRANHQDYADDKGMTLDEVLEYLQTPEGAADVAGWFWRKKDLNTLADAGNFKIITRKINGGLNGYEDRLQFYLRAQAALAPQKAAT